MSRSHFTYYSTLLQAFRFDSPRCPDPKFAELLHSMPLPKLFPNLKHLEIDLENRYADVFQDLIGGPKLQELSVCVGCGSGTSMDLISRVLSEVLSRHANLSSFSYDGYESEKELPAMQQAQMAHFLQSMVHLSSLTIRAFAGDLEPLWAAASHLPDLRQIQLLGRLHKVETPSRLPLNGFPSLIRATIHAKTETMQYIPNVLAPLHSRLEELRLYFTLWAPWDSDCEECPNEEDEDHAELAIDGKLACLSKFSELRLLHVFLDDAQPVWEDWVPILGCHRMEEISMAGRYAGSSLNDDSLERMAEAWPRLRDFSVLNPDWRLRRDYMGDAPYITLFGLAHFSHRCPSLLSIAISVDARGIGPSPPPFEMGSKLHSLNLRYSVAHPTEIKDVATFISKTWPQHNQKSSRDAWEESDRPETISRWRDIWSTVDSILDKSFTVGIDL